MCLAVPGKIVEIREPEGGFAPGAVGTVDFQGSQIEVGLAFTPEAKPGDWVLVHAGFALNVLDEAEAMETWKYLKEAGIAEPPTEESEKSEDRSEN
jgi:hydrogenase expression/formation protein HypC